MKHVRKRLTYANVMSSLAVFLVLGGATAFAATQLGKESVGTSQLKKEAVSLAKIKKAAKNSLKGQTGPAGPQGLKGEKGEKGEKGATGTTGAPGSPGAAGSAIAFAEITAGGTVVTGTAKNITNANITAGSESGIICFHDLPFAWQNVMAIRQGSIGTEGIVVYIKSAGSGCPAGTELTLTNRLFTGGAFTTTGNNLMVSFN